MTASPALNPAKWPVSSMTSRSPGRICTSVSPAAPTLGQTGQPFQPDGGADAGEKLIGPGGAPTTAACRRLPEAFTMFITIGVDGAGVVPLPPYSSSRPIACPDSWATVLAVFIAR